MSFIPERHTWTKTIARKNTIQQHFMIATIFWFFWSAGRSQSEWNVQCQHQFCLFLVRKTTHPLSFISYRFHQNNINKLGSTISTNSFGWIITCLKKKVVQPHRDKLITGYKFIYFLECLLIRKRSSLVATVRFRCAIFSQSIFTYRRSMLQQINTLFYRYDWY